MGIRTSASAWIGFILMTDVVESFFEREDGRTVQELADEALPKEPSEGEDDEEYESDCLFFSEEGRFPYYLEHLLKPYPETNFVILSGANLYTGDENWCAITLEGLSDSMCGGDRGKFEFTEKQKEDLQTIKRVLEGVGFKLRDYSLHCAITTC